jgi:hypothetical protein
MSLLKLNPIEPPWYGPVCPVVWEGWHREVSPYPDHRRNLAVGARNGQQPDSTRKEADLFAGLVRGFLPAGP